jgi:hypothetical protein
MRIRLSQKSQKFFDDCASLLETMEDDSFVARNVACMHQAGNSREQQAAVDFILSHDLCRFVRMVEGCMIPR